MTHREAIRRATNHEPGPIPIDFGSTAVTGVHCSIVAGLRERFGLEKRLVKVIEPYQMLGLIEDDLREAMGLATVGVFGHKSIFGFTQEAWKPWRAPWGQELLVSVHFETTTDSQGNTLIYPEGDRTAPPSGMMPRTGYFFDTIERIDPAFDDGAPRLEDNLEEFGRLDKAALMHWRHSIDAVCEQDRAVVAHLPGTGLGDIALVLAPFLKQPRGVRGVADWYMLLAANPDHARRIFAAQTDIALENLPRLHAVIGDRLDVAVICGTDFGSQTSQFCSEALFRDLWLPFYRRINDWIHTHTTWKTFKHSCGAVRPLIEAFIDCGFDILNPVQCSATGMEPTELKAAYGDRITFWGGGVNNQQTLPFGSPDDVRKEVLARCEVFGKDGGFVFNAIHNVQALTPVENVIAMLDAVRDWNLGAG